VQAEARATDATITVVIVEDHVVVREGTRELFGREGDITVVGEASTVAEAVNLARQLVPTLMVVDIELPDQSGVEVVREVVATGLPVRCLMLSAHDDYVYVSEALAAGAAGYLLTTVSAVELVAAVRAVATGAVVVDESLSRRLAGRLRQPEQTPAASLTSRELDVVRALVRGYSNKEIAAELGVGLRTVESYVSNVLAKLGVRSRTGAIVYAIEHGLVSPRSSE
jgi:DNA-binding NarL/FixJ family response regulator